MGETFFIPHSAKCLYDKMSYEQFIGALSVEEDQLIWKLPNGVIVKAVPNGLFPEWYVATFYLDCGKEIPLTHWHPSEVDIYRDLYEINIGHTFWVVKKKSFFRGKVPMIMEMEEWQKYSEKSKNRYVVL